MKLKNNKWKQVAVYFRPDQWLRLKVECARRELPMATYVKKRLSNVIDDVEVSAHAAALLEKK